MINKRLLIKNLLAHNDECSFYDKKRQLNLHTREGKAKFLKHICGLSNSNPLNNSYIVVGVEDENNEIVGNDFFDDSRIQNLVNAFLEHPPQIQYENVLFPNLPKNKVVGLVTIKPNKLKSFFKKNIYTITENQSFLRQGSTTKPWTLASVPISQNKPIVAALEHASRNSIEATIDGLVDFMNVKHKDIGAKHKVFKDLFVICWSGNSKKNHGNTFYSRVDIELVNERIKLFYSDQDFVTIEFDDDTFTIIEYIPLGINDKTTLYPLEKVTLYFYENGYYKIDAQMVFNPPEFNRKMLFHIYNSITNLLTRAAKGQNLSFKGEVDLINIPATSMICYLNQFTSARELLIDSKELFKKSKAAFDNFKQVMRILRKIKYNK